MSILELPIGVEPKEAKDIALRPPKIITIDDSEVANQFNDFYRIADDIRKPRKLIWDQSWALYNGQYDWTGKEDWQAKVNIPKVREVVDKAAASFRRALIRMKRFYHIESETRLGIEKGLFTMNLIDYWLDQISFIEEFTTGLKSGLITSTIIYKVWWNWVTDHQPRFEDKLVKEPIFELGLKIGERVVPTQELVTTARTRGILGFKAVDPFNMWLGPKSNPYRIEKATVGLPYIVEMQKKGFYDKDAVNLLSSRTGTNIDAYQEAIPKREHPNNFLSKYNRPIDIYHYWGDIYNTEGKVIAHNATYTVGDKDIVLRKPIVNPFLHGHDPYVIGTPYIVPFSTYNRGIVEDIIGIVKMITELSCLIIDGAQFDALQAFEGDVDLLTDPRQAKRGLYPGVFFNTKSFENPSNKNVIRPIATGKIPNLAIQVVSMLDREQQLSTNVTNALKGQSIGSDTLGEFQQLVGAANDALDDAARTVEETVLDDMLDRVAGVIYQYHTDFTLPRLVENFPQTSNLLSDMSLEERFATMLGGFAFKARGVSIFLDKAQDLQKINSFIQMLGNIPGILTRMNVDELIEQIIIAMGWNPQRILLNPASPPVIPAAVLGGQPLPMGPNGMPQFPGAQGSPGFPTPQDRARLTPAQIVAGEMGAKMGGAKNNPRAQRS